MLMSVWKERTTVMRMQNVPILTAALHVVAMKDLLLMERLV